MYQPPAPSLREVEPFLIRHRWLGALLAGSALTVAGLGIAALSRPLGRVLFWPVMGLARLAGPGYNIGTPEQPLYEATPVDLLAIALGFLLTLLCHVHSRGGRESRA